MLTRSCTALLVAVALLALPAAAHAATVQLQSGDAGEQALVYSGDPGEANQVDVAWDRSADRFRITDTGALLFTAGPGCDAVDAIEVACDGAGVTTMRIEGGDGDDEIDDDVPPIPGSSIRWVEIDGGEGADHLTGSSVDEGFDGGPGGDYISGGGGVDSVTEDGVDVDGTGVTITLDALANDGLLDEGDNIRGNVEYIVGGDGSDTMRGNNGNHHLYGAGGDDQIAGKGGNDDVVGGEGADVLSGGAGRDRIDSHDDEGTPTDSVDCGPGWDEARGDPEDQFRANCEQYVVDGVSHFHRATKESGRPPGLPAIVAPTAIVRRRTLIVITGCRESAACAGTLRVTTTLRPRRGGAARTRTLARGKFRARAGQVKLVRLRLSKRAARLARRAHHARAYVVAYGYHGGVRVTRRRVRLR